jgi:hypothetical protein
VRTLRMLHGHTDSARPSAQNKKARRTSRRTFYSVRSVGVAEINRFGLRGRRRRLCYRAAGQPREPQDSHLRKLLRAAHTYSHNWSQITSIFCRANRAVGEPRQALVPICLARPSRGVFEGDCRRTPGGDSRRDLVGRP